MPIISVNILLFAAVTLLLYYLIPKKLQWMLLLAVSFIFYICAGINFLVFILFTVVTTYLTALCIDKRLEKQNKFLEANKQSLTREERRNYKKRIKNGNRAYLAVCLIVNFALLALCKACLIEPLRNAIQGNRLSFLSLGLPLGISFYMFQSAGYVTDVYRSTAKAERNLFKYALFVSFFPQLIQGPIDRFGRLSPMLLSPHKFDGKQVSSGLQLMLWGYFKKAVIADRIFAAVRLLRAPEYTGAGFALLSLFYAVQIYCDFTGGIDIVTGLAEAFGIRLRQNFRRPYFSKNTAEYWRRWHISLGEWMRDYVFYPISVSRPMLKFSEVTRKKLGKFGKRLPVYVASIATWFIVGIWHGLTPNFIIWGMLNCFVIVVSEELSPLYAKFHNRFHLKNKPLYGAFEILRMFTLMNLIRVCDLFPNPSEYFRKLGSLVHIFDFSVLKGGALLKSGLTGLDFAIIGIGCAVVFAVSVLEEKKGSVRELLQKRPAALRYTLIFGLFLTVLLAGYYGIKYNAVNFIYNQF